MLLIFITVVAPPVRGEQRLIKRARAATSSPSSELLAANGPAMRRLAYSMLGSEAAMDDVLQTAYVRAFRALPKLRRPVELRHLAAPDRRQRGGRRAAPDRPARRGRPRSAGGPRGGLQPDIAGASDTRLDLANALAGLPADLRIVVLMVDAEGYSYDEVAEVVGIPPGTVASRLSRARAALRPRWNPDRRPHDRARRRARPRPPRTACAPARRGLRGPPARAPGRDEAARRRAPQI